MSEATDPQVPADGGPPLGTSRRRPFGAVRHSSWRSVLRVLPEGAVRHRPSDIGRVVTAILGVAFLAYAAERYGPLEQATGEVADALPDGLGWLLEGLARLGAFGSITIVALAALLARRIRLAISLVAAGAVAWLTAAGLAVLVTTGGDSSVTLEAVEELPSYPSVSLAVLSAVLLTAKPHLTRPVRPLIGFAITAVTLAVLYTGEGTPSGVLGAIVLGWGVAAATHLAVGSPAGLPPRGQVHDSLGALGVAVDDLTLSPTQAWGELTYQATGVDGTRLRIAVVGRDATDAQLLTKVWHSLWYRETGTVVTVTRTQQIEHRAYLLLLAERAGVRVPSVVAAAVAGKHRDALLVLADRGGTTLDQVAPEAISDAVLDDVWANLRQLHDAGLAHNDLAPSTIELAADGTTSFVDLQAATVTTVADTRATDQVALLVSTAAVVDDERALAAATRALGPDGLADLLPLLQLAALPGRLRRALPDEKQRLAALRDAMVAATGVDKPELASLRRINASDVAMAAATILGVYLLFGQLAQVDLAQVLSEAQWEWVAVAFVFAQLPQFGAAIATLGSVSRPLPLKPTLALQYANNFTGLIGGTVANTALVIRYFQKQGMDPGTAVSSGVLLSVSNLITQIVLVLLGLLAMGASWEVPTSGSSDGDDSAQMLLVAIVVVGAIAGVALLVPRMRKRIGNLVLPQVRAARDNLREVLRVPRKGVELFGGAVISQVFFALVLGASLHAFGASLPLGQLIVINSIASVIGGVAPVPGGMGVMEAGLIAGFTAAGIPEEQAVAATFVARTCTSYLSPIWGWGALQWMRRNDYA